MLSRQIPSVSNAVQSSETAVSAAGALSFFYLRASIARHHHHHESEFQRLNRKMARKNLIALFLYLAAIVAAFICTPLALMLIATLAIIYFLPEHGVGFFVNGRSS